MVLNKIKYRFFALIIAFIVTAFFQVLPVVAQSNEGVAKTKIHKVSKGESLFTIARDNKCTVKELKEWNNLSSDRLDINQKLIIGQPSQKKEADVEEKKELSKAEPSEAIKEQERVKEKPSKKKKSKEKAKKAEQEEAPIVKYHKVKSGDCLSSIAEKYHVSVSSIKKLNHLRSTKLSLGQKLIVSKTTPKKSVLDEKVVYNDDFNFSAMLSDSVKQSPPFVKDSLYDSYSFIDAATAYRVDSIIDYAKTFLGLPYKYRGFGHQFDCSGYIMYVFSKFGYNLPPSSPSQADVGVQIDRKDLRKGDLVFFKGHNSRSRRIGHVGMVIDVDDKSFTMIHSSSSRGIVIERMDQARFFDRRYVTARRVIKS